VAVQNPCVGSVAEQSPILSTRRPASVVALKEIREEKKTKLLNGPTPLSIGRENDVAIAHFCIVLYCPCVRKLPLNRIYLHVSSNLVYLSVPLYIWTLYSSKG
jgi:hypothetical protein